MARPSYESDSLLVGVVGRPHGLDGEFTLRPHNGRGTDLSDVPALIFERGDRKESRKVRTARRGVDGWLIRIEGVDSRDAAAALTHAQVRVQKQALPPLGPGEFFVEDLLGCEVRTDTGDILGEVAAVFWNGAHDVMSVSQRRPDEAKHERRVDSDGSLDDGILIPVVPAFVREVDVSARRVVVAWEGHD